MTASPKARHLARKKARALALGLVAKRADQRKHGARGHGSAGSAAAHGQSGVELGENLEVVVLSPYREIVGERGRGDDRVHRARSATLLSCRREQLGQAVSDGLVVRKGDEPPRPLERCLSQRAKSLILSPWGALPRTTVPVVN